MPNHPKLLAGQTNIEKQYYGRSPETDGWKWEWRQ
jgi:hypothetical protein